MTRNQDLSTGRAVTGITGAMHWPVHVMCCQLVLAADASATPAATLPQQINQACGLLHGHEAEPTRSRRLTHPKTHTTRGLDWSKVCSGKILSKSQIALEGLGGTQPTHC